MRNSRLGPHLNKSTHVEGLTDWSRSEESKLDMFAHLTSKKVYPPGMGFSGSAPQREYKYKVFAGLKSALM